MDNLNLKAFLILLAALSLLIIPRSDAWIWN